MLRLIQALTNQDRPTGSSFAVTTDNWSDNWWTLWMSKVSLDYLLEKNLLPNAIYQIREKDQAIEDGPGSVAIWDIRQDNDA